MSRTCIVENAPRVPGDAYMRRKSALSLPSDAYMRRNSRYSRKAPRGDKENNARPILV